MVVGQAVITGKSGVAGHGPQQAVCGRGRLQGVRPPGRAHDGTVNLPRWLGEHDVVIASGLARGLDAAVFPAGSRPIAPCRPRLRRRAAGADDAPNAVPALRQSRFRPAHVPPCAPPGSRDAPRQGAQEALSAFLGGWHHEPV